ncbi:MAG TPA: hypothetical protein PLU43_00525 [Lachnospiraceae bacterium]|nr:hypothetical protein [Lachnospiraceae bacterium]
MKSKEEIEIDFSRAIAQAQELEDIAKELSQIASAHIAGALEMLALNWQGENAKQYADKGKILTKDMFETADDLIKVAKNIRLTAGIVYDAEKTAVGIGY